MSITSQGPAQCLAHCSSSKNKKKQTSHSFMLGTPENYKTQMDSSPVSQSNEKTWKSPWNYSAQLLPGCLKMTCMLCSLSYYWLLVSMLIYYRCLLHCCCSYKMNTKISEVMITYLYYCSYKEKKKSCQAFLSSQVKRLCSFSVYDKP